MSGVDTSPCASDDGVITSPLASTAAACDASGEVMPPVEASTDMKGGSAPVQTRPCAFVIMEAVL